MKKRIIAVILVAVIFAAGVAAGFIIKNKKIKEPVTEPSSSVITTGAVPSQAETSQQPETEATEEKTSSDTTKEKKAEDIEIKGNALILSKSLAGEKIQSAEKIIKAYNGKKEGFSGKTEEDVYEEFEESCEFIKDLGRKSGGLEVKINDDEDGSLGGFTAYPKTDDMTVDEIAEEAYSYFTDEKAEKLLSGNIFEAGEFVFIRNPLTETGSYYDTLGVDRDGDKYICTFVVTAVDSTTGNVKSTRRQAVSCVKEDGKYVFDEITDLHSAESYYAGLR